MREEKEKMIFFLEELESCMDDHSHRSLAQLNIHH
jgi:hypothetical protein